MGFGFLKTILLKLFGKKIVVVDYTIPGSGGGSCETEGYFYKGVLYITKIYTNK